MGSLTVLGSLKRDPRFDDPEIYNVFARLVSVIPGLIPDRLDNLVGYINFHETRLELASYMGLVPVDWPALGYTEALYEFYSFVKDTRRLIAGFTGSCLKERQIMLSGQTGLSPRSQELYRRNELTFRALLDCQAGALIFTPKLRSI